MKGAEYEFGERSDRLVEAWASFRLPFEPQTESAKSFRAQLAAAVGSLRGRGQEFLSGTYVSRRGSTEADVENVLFYNVGTSAFARAARTGLRFERCFGLPASSPAGTSYQHHWRYELTTTVGTFAQWRMEPLAHFETELTPGALHDPSAIWWAVKRSRPAVARSSAERPFVLLMRLTGPPAPARNLANDIKPLFDGVISAFHCQSGSLPHEVGERIAARLSLNRKDVDTALADAERAVLGPRNLVHLRAAGVQWNPADHLCVAGELLADHGAASQHDCLRLCGTLMEAMSAVSTSRAGEFVIKAV